MNERLQIRRTIGLDASPDRVWDALTEESLLRDWLAPEVELDAREGGSIACREENGGERAGEIIAFEPARRLAFRWSNEEGVESTVELLVDAVAGGARLTVTETAAGGAAPGASALWGERMQSLRLCLASLVYA